MTIAALDYAFRPFEYDRDIETLCEFHRDHVKINFPDSLYVDSLWPDQVRKEAATNRDGLLMVIDSASIAEIGFLWLKVQPDPFKSGLLWGDLHYIHLAPVARGRGLGEKLMQFIEEFFTKRGAKEIRLGTDARNAASRKLYDKLGYEVKRVIYEKKI